MHGVTSVGGHPGARLFFVLVFPSLGAAAKDGSGSAFPLWTLRMVLITRAAPSVSLTVAPPPLGR